MDEIMKDILPVESSVSNKKFELPESNTKNTFQRLIEIVVNNSIKKMTLLSTKDINSIDIDGQCRLYKDGFEAVTFPLSTDSDGNNIIGTGQACLYVDRHPKQSIKVEYMF